MAWLLRLLSWLIGLPLTVLTVLFALSNRDLVALALWPLNDRLEAPLFLVALLPLGIGILIGGVLAAPSRRSRSLPAAVAVETSPSAS